ncbi:DUF1194 domain-containing protein [Pannonibacter carbonis]|uniref:DUF1194 domain-containing protein n=1 Tax=Pannonibacter carbonis TaxID=2067569 RepID=UPI000D101387|nr:DUF1194 domain-containing protein [Pannonibacter carbonis]
MTDRPERQTLGGIGNNGVKQAHAPITQPCGRQTVRGRLQRVLSLLSVLGFLTFGPSVSLATAQTTPEEVDVALVLAVDISYSMDMDELALQRSGYRAAITSNEVMQAIASGLTGKIAILYLEWAGSESQAVLVDWHVIGSPEDAANFAAALAETPVRRAYRTAIGDALLYSAAQFDRMPVTAMKRVIDVSGDGPNNQGTFAPVARDEVIARGIVINGLPLQLKLRSGSWSDMDNLDVYYETCVIGGPGAFVVPVRGADRFAEAIRRKLVLEIAGLPPAGETARVIRAATGIDPFCLEGERRWQMRNRYEDQ